MAKLNRKSKRFLATVALLNGEAVEDVEKKYGKNATDMGRMTIQYHIEAKKLVSSARVLQTTQGVTTNDLIGCDKYIKQMVHLLKYGHKAVFLGGYHGLGKTTMVYEAAKKFGAEVIRLQVTELLSEVDIIGSPDPKTGEFILSEFVQSILEAKKNPSQNYFLLLDEFTRGRPEALNVLFPILAEKTLFNNSVYANPEHKVIKLPDNVKVLGTGNVNDKGLRDVGEAEFDRWNGIEILPITNSNQLGKMIKQRSRLTDPLATSKLIKFYKLSWQYGNEMRILPMSHRTLIETAELSARKIMDGVDVMDALKDTLDETYLTASQAILNPNFKQTYHQMRREVL